MSKLTLQDKLRTAHTKRWGIVNVGRTQNVAEHSFLVQIIAVFIGKKIGYVTEGGPFNTEKEFHIMRWAMWHDMVEVKTGDINTPMKAMINSVGGKDTIEVIEYNISSEYKKICEETSPTIKGIVKLADFMEALNFLNEEGKGTHAKEVADSMKKQMLKHYDQLKRKHLSMKWDKIEKTILELGG